MSNKPIVYLALSGGVDSAVSAYLLKKQGFEVRAVYMKNWTGTHLNLAGECNWTYERDDAKKVAKHLNLPFVVWDFEREYRKWVIDYFFREYKRGRTPNPDVRCNQYVKIPLFLSRALKEGGDFIATGHYARKSEILNTKSETNTKPQISKYQLLNGVDSEKDQSYFLYTLTQNQLKHLLFPLGEMAKVAVRRLAVKINLPVAKKPDSQGICFVGEVRIEDFLKTRIKAKPGLVVDLKGNQLGEHHGLAFYTVGQRHGLGLSGGPWYVIGRRWKQNVLIVGKLKEQRYLLADTLIASQVNWVLGVQPRFPFKALARHRYRHPVFSVTISRLGKNLRVKFTKQQRAITPGQSIVFYRKATGRGLTRLGLYVLGGATIDKVEKKEFSW